MEEEVGEDGVISIRVPDGRTGPPSSGGGGGVGGGGRRGIMSSDESLEVAAAALGLPKAVSKVIFHRRSADDVSDDVVEAFHDMGCDVKVVSAFDAAFEAYRNGTYEAILLQVGFCVRARACLVCVCVHVCVCVCRCGCVL